MTRITIAALLFLTILAGGGCSPSPQAAPASVNIAAADITLIRAENDTESTELRFRGDAVWDEVSLEDGTVRFSFEETARTAAVIAMTDYSRNGGLSLRIDLERGVIELSEGAGRPFYDRYRITLAQ